MPGFSGVFALDDYGSGYSNEKTLLELAPAYIKLDLSIIRDIDSDPDKQQIVENIVSYAHQLPEASCVIPPLPAASFQITASMSDLLLRNRYRSATRSVSEQSSLKKHP